MATRLTYQAEPLPGYRLIDRLGRGGYGEVWKAEAPGGLFKAIKFVYGDLEAAGDDNKAAAQELKALNRVKSIRHPFILSIERFDIIDGQLMIVMELADKNLWDRFQECRSQSLPGIPRDELLRYLDESSEALDLMNGEYQIQHLDIKPQNLFLVHNHVKVADFGLAKDLEGIRATVTGGVTPVYAAPETFEGWISRYCDQYSLAIVYQELLTGIRPFSGTNTRQLLMQHITAAPDLSSLPLTERSTVGRALAKNPEERYPSCGEFVRALREAQRAASSAESRAPAVVDPPKAQPNYQQSAAEALTAETNKSDSPIVTQSTVPKPLPPKTPVPKGLPALVTPGAAATSSPTRIIPPGQPLSGAGPAASARPFAPDTGQLSKVGVASLERIGSGVLFPALLVGVGRLGMQVLQGVRACIQNRFGRKSFPHWKWLFIDTDGQTIQEASAGDPKTNLEPGETYWARMHRMAHYVKRDGLPPPETWMSAAMLYRIPREPATAGIRGLGRLAFCDHILAISQRIRQNLESFLDDAALMEADRQTNLGVRDNRPRVYVASSIGGGSGSGMLIDLAYVIRHEMRQLGFVKPRLTGLLLTPPVDRSSPKNLAAANAHATLAELRHFSQPSNRYEARLDTRQDTLADPDRPFENCVLLGLPRSPSKKTPPAVERAARFICQEALTPLGRSMDEARSRYQREKPPASLPLQSFGCYRISWPRQRLLETAALRLSAMTVQRWCANDIAEARAEVAAWIDDDWRRRQLDPTSLKNALHSALAAASGEAPEALIEAEIRSLSSDLSARDDLPRVVSVVDRILNLVGHPGQEEETSPGRLFVALEAAAKPVARDAEVQFARMAVHFIEQPGRRLAAAEEAIRLATARLQTLIDEQEKQLRLLDEAVAIENRRLTPLLGALSKGGVPKPGGRRAEPASELTASLRSFAKRRLEWQTERSIASIYRQMLGNAPNYKREVVYCRHQLGEVSAALVKQAAAAEAGADEDHLIVAAGCKGLLEYAQRIVEEIPAEEFQRFEEGLQQQIRRRSRALVSVCLAMKEQGIVLQQTLFDQAREFLDARLGHRSTVEELFRSRPDEQSIHREILRAYDESSPEPFGPNPRPDAQSFILGVAVGADGARLTEMTQELLPGIPLTVAPSADEIVFYREIHDLAWTDVPQAGVLGADAAQEVRNRDRVEPHARLDVQWSGELQ